MKDVMKRIFGKITGEDAGARPRGGEHDLCVAICALFLEMAKIDGEFTDAEMATILSILKEKYGLSDEYADAIIEEADRELAESVDDWRFAQLINENYTSEEKVEIIELLWRIIYLDGKLDQHENYLIHKVSNLLRLPHKELIDAKLKVLESVR